MKNSFATEYPGDINFNWTYTCWCFFFIKIHAFLTEQWPIMYINLASIIVYIYFHAIMYDWIEWSSILITCFGFSTNAYSTCVKPHRNRWSCLKTYPAANENAFFAKWSCKCLIASKQILRLGHVVLMADAPNIQTLYHPWLTLATPCSIPNNWCRCVGEYLHAYT